MHGRDARVKRAVRVAVVNVLDVDASRSGAFLHQRGEQIGSRQGTLADIRVLLVFRVETLEFVLVGKECVVQTGNFVGREQRDVAAFNQAGVQQAVDLHAVIQLADAVVFYAAVVFQDQQAFGFDVPQGVEQGCRAAAYAALRAGFDRRLEHFEKRNAAGVLRFAATNFAAQTADASGVDADARTLGNVFHNRAGGGVDGIQTVVAFNQYAA